jgi:hypothetical protein
MLHPFTPLSLPPSPIAQFDQVHLSSVMFPTSFQFQAKGNQSFLLT